MSRRHDGAVVGCAVWFLTFSTWDGVHGIYLEDLYVTPDQRGTGLGFALLAALARECVRNGYTRLQWAVLDWNTPSIEFYDKLGAKPLDEWITYRLSGDALQELGAAETVFSAFFWVIQAPRLRLARFPGHTGPHGPARPRRSPMLAQHPLPTVLPHWDQASERGPRQVNADATAVHTDPETGVTAYVVADGVGDDLVAVRTATIAAEMAGADRRRSGAGCRHPGRSGSHSGQ